MSKFGHLISSSEYVFFSFYSENNRLALQAELNNIAEALKDKAKVINIDIEKNRELTAALRITNFPTYVLYKNEEMVWRNSSDLKSDEIMNLIQQYFQE
ncbi:thioredoxin family protein [Aquimarina celericrescens]|nr:thioredoxin family protein [Aquimarina celericrescens]